MSHVTLPSVRDIQNIVTHDQESEFDGVTLAELWGNAVAHLPEIRKCHLEDDHTDVLRSVYTSLNLERVLAAYDFVCVRMAFVSLLALNQIGHPHVLRYLTSDTTQWLQSLGDKIQQIIPGEIYKRRVVAAPTFPPKTTHMWLH